MSGQQKLNVDNAHSCSWEEDNVRDDLYGFAPDDQAQKFVNNIVKYAGLPPNFTIKAANVSNARATMENNQRLLLYNQDFIQHAIKAGGTPWAAIGIMAHEIGHHLSGHTLGNSGATRMDEELQADQFAGHILFQMGATRDEVTSPLNSLTSSQGDSLHPPKSARIAAFTAG
jgi:Zn-dependent peptidase ImmA (M78 family)